MNKLGNYGSESEGSDDDVKPASLSKASSSKAKRKIRIGLPALTVDQPDEPDERPTKRIRAEAGSGSSSLFSMLPAPQNNNAHLPPRRLVSAGDEKGARDPQTDQNNPADTHQPTSLSFLPPAVGKSQAKVFEEPKNAAVQSESVDFFALGSSSSTSSSHPSFVSSSINTKVSSVPTISSAPILPTFEPPEPTPNDEYPGYYRLPSGAWAAYDPEYYAGFLKKWQRDYDSHVRALEKGKVKGFEEADKATMEEVNAQQEMERAKVEVKLREERKALTRDAGSGAQAPRMKITAAKQSGIARARHQLATMLTEAYTNREALEEKIAQGKRNRKEAGNKYGF